jgi:hypothetical protein
VARNFSDSIGGNPIQLLDLQQILAAILPVLTTTLAGIEVGRCSSFSGLPVLSPSSGSGKHFYVKFFAILLTR